MPIPSFLIVDASILFSFFKKDSERRRIFESLSLKGCRLLVPSYLFDELSSKQERIKRYAKIDGLAFSFLLSLLDSRIETFEAGRYCGLVQEAEDISPHKEDAAYFALALVVNAPIWSDEEAFRRQSKVEIFTTNMLDRLLREE